MRESDIPFVSAEVRILYGIDQNGEQVVSVTYVADGVDDSAPDFFTGLTMFEVAKLDFLKRHEIIQPGRTL